MDSNICDGKKCGQGIHVSRGSYLCQHKNLGILFPNLVEQWHITNEKSIYDYLPNSHDRVVWICSDDKSHIWETRIDIRTRSKLSGCPYCSGHKLSSNNNLEMQYPQLKTEWDPRNLKAMSEYFITSTEKVSWICSKHNSCKCHVWITAINVRTIQSHGCPFCSNNKCCSHNNLEVKKPNLKKEWHPDNKPMSLYATHSSEKVKWICQKNTKHVWSAVICDRTGKLLAGCPQCSYSKGYSKSQIIWLTEIEKIEEINIQHACKDGGEFVIPGIGKVDGYCKENNTVYEYHGDYWHGNPKVY